MKKIFLLLTGIFFSFSLFAQLSQEELQIKKTFDDFLDFYQKNESQFQSFNLYEGLGKDGDNPYQINWQEVDKYFDFLRNQVPYVGERYIEVERKHFKEADSMFKLYPDEIMPFGFDYDRYINGQEAPEIVIPFLTSPDNIYEVKIKGNRALLKIGVKSSQEDESIDWSIVPFVKENNQWKMAGNVIFKD